MPESGRQEGPPRPPRGLSTEIRASRPLSFGLDVAAESSVAADRPDALFERPVRLTRLEWSEEGPADALALLIREATCRPVPCRDHPDLLLSPGHEDVELIGPGHPAPLLRDVGDPCPVE